MVKKHIFLVTNYSNVIEPIETNEKRSLFIKFFLAMKNFLK